jgi:hypothetical protein
MNATEVGFSLVSGGFALGCYRTLKAAQSAAKKSVRATQLTVDIQVGKDVVETWEVSPTLTRPNAVAAYSCLSRDEYDALVSSAES